MSRKLSDTLEMYLKTILQLERHYQPVRVRHIAKERKVSSASVTEAIQTLLDKGLVLHEPYAGVRLSAKGRRLASEVEARYEVLRYFLAEVLGLDERLARRDACEIEHVASPETMDRLRVFLEYVNRCKMNVSGVIAHFLDYYTLRAGGGTCGDCEAGKKEPWSLELPQ